MLRDEINEALKKAMKDQNKRRLATLRLINAAVKDRDIAARTDGKDAIGEDDIRQLLSKMIRQREESSQVYAEAGRTELAEDERAEIEIIKGFLPRQLSDDEVKSACEEVVKDIGASGLRDMGKCMSALKARFPGQIDMGQASSVVKGILN